MLMYDSHNVRRLGEAIIQLVAFAYNSADTNPNQHQKKLSMDVYMDRRDKVLEEFSQSFKAVFGR